MRLEMASFPVREVLLAETTEYCEGVLRVDRIGLEARLAQDPAFRSVRLDLAYPGERVRIVHVLDVLEPRCKPDRPGAAFPGLLGGPETVGDGRTNRLAGLAIVESGQFQQAEGLQMTREGIIDMTGPAAELVPFSNTINLVAMFEPKDGVSNADYDHAIRLAGARLAEELARATLGQEPADVRTYSPAEPRPGLPRVAWICLVQSLGLLEHTLVYGESVVGKLPMVFHPNEVLDGAVVSGNFLFSAIRNRTYLYQNSALLEELYALDGRELSLVGVVLSPGMRHTLPEKERVAAFAAKTAALLGADSAIITMEGGGHGNVDLMLTCNRCEQLGIKTVLVNSEAVTANSTDTSFIYVVPEADAIVSTGNPEAIIELPPVERVIGGDLLDIEGEVYRARDGFVTSVRPLCAATSQIGANRLTVLQY
jgi:glycine reductase complex component B subunit alpha and beta